MAAILRVESAINPFAIGVVGARLTRQPTNRAEAVATARALDAAGYNFSLGIGQVNRYNLAKYGLDYDRAFEPCANVHAASRILKDCYARAKATRPNDQDALQKAFSCYYSGNFSTGFRQERNNRPSYVQKVLDSAAPHDAAQRVRPIDVMPDHRSRDITPAHADSVVRISAAVPSHDAAVPAQQSTRLDAAMVYR